MARHNHLVPGRNSRLDGLQAAILSAKLPHLPRWVSARQHIAARYARALAVPGVTVRPASPEVDHAYHLFVIEVADRDTLRAALRAEGIETGVHYPCPLPLLPAFADLSHRAEEFPVAVERAARILSLPMFPELTDAQVDRVSEAVLTAVRLSGAGSPA